MSQSYEFGDYRLDPIERKVWHGGRVVPLTPKELDILMILVQRAGRPVQTDEILKEAWPGVVVSGDNVKTHITSMRKKLPHPEIILTRRHQGYQLAAHVALASTERTLDSSSASMVEQTSAPRESPIGEPYREFSTDITRPSFKGLETHRWLPGAMLLTVVAIATCWLWQTRPTPVVIRLPEGRLFARSTSEGTVPFSIPLQHRASLLAISPHGDKVFATEDYGVVLSIVDVRKNNVQTLRLPEAAAVLAPSTDGTLYVASKTEGIMVVNTDRRQLQDQIIHTGGSVRDIAVTPTGETLYLAMGANGLKRYSTKSRKLTVLSKWACPENLRLDPLGRRLYVAYQCDGPGGTPGHDVVEIRDTDTEKSLGIIGGIPMVGGPPFLSPNRGMLILNGQDACSRPTYEKKDCGVVPGSVVHLFNTVGPRLIRSFWQPLPDAGAMRFLDDSRLLKLGHSISVIDAFKYSVLERLDLGDDGSQSAAFAPDGSRAYFGRYRSNSILVFPFESTRCSLPQRGLGMLYAGDGSYDDAIEPERLERHGNPQFKPGRIGQAFYLDGASFLSMPWTGFYRMGEHDMTIMLYAKSPAASRSETLLDWTDGERRGIRLAKSEDGHFVAHWWSDQASLRSENSVIPEAWYHLALTVSEKEFALYVNGKLQGRVNASSRFQPSVESPMSLGGQAHENSHFHGMIDDLAFYTRALGGDEIKSAYELREAEPCKM